MLVAIVSFAAGALTALAALRTVVRRSVIAEVTEELTDRRWQSIMGAAGYGASDGDVADRATARFEAELARGTTPRRARVATLTPVGVVVLPAAAPGTMPGVVFRVKP